MVDEKAIPHNNYEAMAIKDQFLESNFNKSSKIKGDPTMLRSKASKVDNVTSSACCISFLGGSNEKRKKKKTDYNQPKRHPTEASSDNIIQFNRQNDTYSQRKPSLLSTHHIPNNNKCKH